jgi:hypothetical protein
MSIVQHPSRCILPEPQDLLVVDDGSEDLSDTEEDDDGDHGPESGSDCPSTITRRSASGGLFSRHPETTLDHEHTLLNQITATPVLVGKIKVLKFNFPATLQEHGYSLQTLFDRLETLIGATPNKCQLMRFLIDVGWQEHERTTPKARKIHAGFWFNGARGARALWSPRPRCSELPLTPNLERLTHQSIKETEAELKLSSLVWFATPIPDLTSVFNIRMFVSASKPVTVSARQLDAYLERYDAAGGLAYYATAFGCGALVPLELYQEPIFPPGILSALPWNQRTNSLTSVEPVEADFMYSICDRALKLARADVGLAPVQPDTEQRQLLLQADVNEVKNQRNYNSLIQQLHARISRCPFAIPEKQQQCFLGHVARRLDLVAENAMKIMQIKVIVNPASLLTHEKLNILSEEHENVPIELFSLKRSRMANDDSIHFPPVRRSAKKRKMEQSSRKSPENNLSNSGLRKAMHQHLEQKALALLDNTKIGQDSISQGLQKLLALEYIIDAVEINKDALQAMV